MRQLSPVSIMVATRTDVFCDTCKKMIEKETDKYLVCCDCGKYFDKKCLKLTDYFFKKFLNSEWKCKMCEKKFKKTNHRRSVSLSEPLTSNTVLNTSPLKTSKTDRSSVSDNESSYGDANDVITVAAQIHQEPEETVQPTPVKVHRSNVVDKPLWVEELQNSLKEVLHKQDDLSSAFEEMKKSMINIQKEVSSLREQNNSLRKENEKLKKSVDNFHYRLNTVEQRSLINDIEISGIPEMKQENVLEIVNHLNNAAGGVKLNNFDIITAFRKPQRSKKSGLPKPILVKFMNNKKKNEFITTCKKLKKDLNTRIIGLRTAPRPIYVNESLTKTTAFLLAKLKELNKGKFKYIWVKNGKILLRRVDKDPVIRLHNLEHLNDLVK